MLVEFRVLLLIVYSFKLCECIEDEWRLYENKFKHHNREELFIVNATTYPNFKSNFIVKNWKTITAGTTCYNGGITNGTMLVLLFSTPSTNGTGITIESKFFDLEQPVSDIEFFQERKYGNHTLYVIVYNPEKKKLIWYSVVQYSLNKVWSLSLEKSVTHFQTFKMNKQNFLLTTIANNSGSNSVIIYGFDITKLEYWYYQSIKLQHPTFSSCLTTIDDRFYLSVTQPASNKLLIYQFVDRNFIPFHELESPQINQVVCFENGFKSFIAFDGLNAGIYEFTKEDLEKKKVVNSNLEGIQFWLPIPVNTYRDETILLCQRRLDHDTHSSFEIDVITYDGKRFEEHIDIPCSLFGETQSGLKCLTEYNSNTGISGSSYISISDHLALIVPNNSSSILVNLKIDLKKVEHPAKKELESLLERKKMLEAMINDQKKQLTKISEKQKQEQLNMSKKTPHLKSAEAKSNKNENAKVFKLKNDILDIVREIEMLNEQTKDRKPFGKENKYGTIIFNGPVEIKKDLSTETFNTKDIEIIDELMDIVRKNQLNPIEAFKTFNDLTVNEISFEYVNGMPSNEFITYGDGITEINGDMTFENPINVQNVVLDAGLMNDLEISKWAGVDNLVEGSLHFEHLDVGDNFETLLLNNRDIGVKSTNLSKISLDIIDNLDTLVIPGNVTVEQLNGHDFETFLRKLCLKNVKCHIPSLTISGILNIKESADIKFLNGLRFPENFVGLEPKEEVVITGIKDFKNITRGYKVTTNGSINNINLSKVVTLSGEERINGTLIFDNLEVMNGLNVHGTIKGKEIKKFVPNIGLKETKNIKSNVTFRNLNVLGDIIIKSKFDGTEFHEYLNDFILKNENATVNGTKTFPQGFTVLENFYITSNFINNISLDSIVTKDTNQALQLNSILGNVDFDDLYVKGLFHGQNITDLNRTLVRLTGNQTIDTELIFDEDILVETLIVDELKKQNKTSNTSQYEEIDFNELAIENVVIEGNLIGNIENFDLKELDENYLKYVEAQFISKPYFIHKLTVHNINPKNINNVTFGNMFSYQKLRENITDILTYRNATVHTMNIEGNLNATKVNRKDFQNILNDHVVTKLHRNASNLIIDGNIYFETLEIDKLASAHFDEYVNILVFKNETDIEIQNSVIFNNGIRVRKLLETSTLNGIPLTHVLRTAGNQTLLGPINILGDVTIKDDLTVKEMINNVEVTYMLDNFDLGEESLKVKGEVLFQRMSYIRNLTIDGLINRNNFTKLQTNFVYVNGDVDLEKDILFNEMVHINGNLGISKDINGIVLSEFVPRVVWLTQDGDIQGPVRFTHSVDCFKVVNIEDEINTKLLFGQDFEERISRGVFVNKGFLEGTFRFENLTIHEDLKTKFINDLDLNSIIPLKTLQQINDLDIKEMSTVNDFNVGNEVNGVSLMVERNRTLLSNVQQYVPSEIEFLNNVLVEDNLITPAINNKPTSKIVTTNTDQNLTATYNFNSKCFADGHLFVKGLINRVNLTSWKNNAIPAHSVKAQHIEEKWMVMENLNLVGSLNGNGLLNDINITQLVEDMEKRQSYMNDIEQGIENDYKNLCKDVSYIYKKAQNQINKFKYFEEFQTLAFPNHIHFVKHFEYNGKHYMLVNEEKSCFSDLLVLGQKQFSKIKTIQTGGISQVVVSKDNTDLFLISNGLDVNDLVCNIRFSTLIWKFTGDDMQVLASIEVQELLQESQVSQTFYGLQQGVVTEFRIDMSNEEIVEKYRKWYNIDENAAFFPRGLKTSLALHTGKSALFLNRDDPVIDDEYDIEATIIGNFTKIQNHILPGRKGGHVAVVNVGLKGAKKTLLAVANHKETQVEQRLDIVEIYLDSFTGELFDEILSYRPTDLTSVEFGNGETLLAFMENRKVLQIYEYRGIEGFRHRSSIKMQATRMFLMEMEQAKVLGLVHNNKITLLDAVMTGRKIKDDLQCTT